MSETSVYRELTQELNRYVAQNSEHLPTEDNITDTLSWNVLLQKLRG